MNSNNLEESGCIQRIYGMTPAGGDYSEAHFFDSDDRYTTKDKAVRIIIRECKRDGELIKETYLAKRQDESIEEKKYSI